MKWCERCGRFFVTIPPATTRYITRPATARGPLIDIETSVCNPCMKPYETWDDNGLLNDQRTTTDRD